MKVKILFGKDGFSKEVVSGSGVFKTVSVEEEYPAFEYVENTSETEVPVDPKDPSKGTTIEPFKYRSTRVVTKKRVVERRVLVDEENTYDVDLAPGYFKNADGAIRPMTDEELFNLLPKDQKVAKELHPAPQVFKAFLDSCAKKPELAALFDGTPFAAEITHHKSVLDKYKA